MFPMNSGDPRSASIVTTQRIFMVFRLMGFGLAAATLLASTRAAEKPNILYIVADDLGSKDLGFQGATDLKTPNLDRLAKEAARLRQFYVQPMCTPTRAAMFTGRYPFRYGLQTLVIPSKGTYGLAKDEVLLPQILKDAGYETAMVGKWHLGHADRAFWPRQRGFDYHYGPVLGEIDYFTHSAHGVLDWQRDNRVVKEEGYVTELLGQDAVRIIDAHDPRKPLFLYLAFTAPHAPYQAPAKYLERFKGIADETRRAYAAMIACLDDEIGAVFAALKEKGMWQNTIVIFHSDNGGTRDRRMTGESTVASIPCDNGALRGGKGELYEGGTRTPALVAWPGHIAPRDVEEKIHVVDMLPTLAKIAGASTAACKPLDGWDVSPTLLQGKPSDRKEIVYNVEPFRAALREGDWKLVWTTLLPSKVEIYDLAKDPNETTNLAAENPELVRKLQARVEQLATESAKPLFFGTGMEAIMGGIFGPASIPAEEMENLP
jgi:arylsulfatase A-like enzyme